MEGTQSKKKQKGKGRKNSDVQQKTEKKQKLQDTQCKSREAEHTSKSHLSSLEAQVRCELKDSKARLTQGNSKGRVQLEIHEESLNFCLNQLKKEKKWSRERELMLDEIYGLRAQLDEAQATHIHSPPPVAQETVLTKISSILQNAQNFCKQQTPPEAEHQVKAEPKKDKKKVRKNDQQKEQKEKARKFGSTLKELGDQFLRDVNSRSEPPVWKRWLNQQPLFWLNWT